MQASRTVVVGTGSHFPARIVPNQDFLGHDFRAPGGRPYPNANDDIITAFQRITGIAERRHVEAELACSDLALLAAREALDSSGVDPESLDHLIVAHNFGDVRAAGGSPDLVPSLAARVKRSLGIRNPGAVAYDVLFGCPGWVQAVVQADCFLRSGQGRRALVIGAETLSRVSDPHDRDSMIYADGAGAAILEAVPSDRPIGVLAHACRTDAVDHARLLRMGESNLPEQKPGFYLKMDGRAVYEYALATVPATVKLCLDRAGVAFTEVSKILIHQANAKMDEAIVQRLARLCGAGSFAPSLVPMTISWLGNSSVATVPTLLDLLLKGRLDGHGCGPGDVLVLASVGAGMSVNALAYRCP